MRRFGESESNYLNGKDLLKPDGTHMAVNVQIESVTLENIGFGEDKDEKFVLYFSGKQKGMALNVTNENVLIELYGCPNNSASSESLTQYYRGKRVQIYFDETVKYAGKPVGGLRLRGAQANSGQRPPPPPPPPVQDESWDDDSSVPF